jgi:hypothetical protein
MAKPIELVTTLKGEDARIFLRSLRHPRQNKAWERTLARSRRFDKIVERCLVVPQGRAVRRRRACLR